MTALCVAMTAMIVFLFLAWLVAERMRRSVEDELKRLRLYIEGVERTSSPIARDAKGRFIRETGL